MPKLTEAQVKKHNREVTRFLVQRLRKLPPKILGRLTNAVVRAAVTNTYQDSGKFAWNWKVQWGGGETLGSTSSEYGVSPVGLRHEGRGTGHREVVAASHKAIGFSMSGLSAGPMFRAIVEDNPAQVRVLNPFYKGLYGKYAAEGKIGAQTAAGGTVKMKENVPLKIDEAVSRESARVKYEIRYKGLGE